jgi:arginine decarboxylase
LIKVLITIAKELSARHQDSTTHHRRIVKDRIQRLTEKMPPLPNFSRFHAAFVTDSRGDTPEGDMRSAFFLAYDESTTEYLAPDEFLHKALSDGREVVSAAFVTPYPPGFPILVPGQVLTDEILTYLQAVNVKEIHGFKHEYGLKVFRQQVLDDRLKQSPTPL